MKEVVFSEVCKDFVRPAKRKMPELKVRALRNVSVTINSGEFVALVGPSGCGKTTFLRLIAGLEDPTWGHIYFDGKRVDDLTPGERNVALVFQQYALYPKMTAFENMAVPLSIKGYSPADIRNIVYNVSKILDIDYLLNKKPKHMSIGQRQRVALGRAICREPDVMLMDEPLSGADEKLRDELRDIIRDLHNEYRFTCVYVTHNMKDAVVLADRIFEMKDGRIKRIITHEELVSNTFERDPDDIAEWYEFLGNGGIKFDPETGKMITKDN